MKRKVIDIWIIWNFLFVLFTLVSIQAGYFDEINEIKYLFEEESTDIFALQGNEEVNIILKNTLLRIDNLVLKFSGCDNRKNGFLSVRIYDDLEEYYTYEVPVKAFSDDIFYLYTNELPELEKDKSYSISVQVRDLGDSPIYLHCTDNRNYLQAKIEYRGYKYSKLSPIIGGSGLMVRMSGMLSSLLLLWFWLEVIYIISVVIWKLYKNKKIEIWTLLGAVIKRLHSQPKYVFAQMGVLVLMLAGLVFGILHYGENAEIERSHEYWSQTNISEVTGIPLKDGEVVQEFKAEYDYLQEFLLMFNDYSPQDQSTLRILIEDKKGNVYYDWSIKTKDIGGETYCFMASVDRKLKKGHLYKIRIFLNNSQSDISVWAVEGKPKQNFVGRLEVDGIQKDNTSLYIRQQYGVKYSSIWVWILAFIASAALFIIFTFFPNERNRRIWICIKDIILVGICYYIIEGLSGYFHFVEFRQCLINCLIIFSFYLVLKALFSRGAYYITVISALVVGLANYYVLQFRGSEVMVTDIKSFSTAMSVAGNYIFEITAEVYTAVFITICFLFILSTADIRWKRKNRRVLIRLRLLYVTSGIIWGIMISNVFTRFDSSLFNYFMLSDSFSKLGWCYTNVFIAKYSSIQKPSNYTNKEIENILFKVNEEENDEFTVAQNIIVIMNESLSDLSIVGDLKTNQDYMPFIRNLNNNAIKGNLHVSTFGGGTCITEYEFLTGNSQYFLPGGSVPYSSVCKDYEEGICRTLKQQGYHTLAMHPYGASNWNRDKVYPAMGFDEFYDITDYSDAELCRKFVSDKADYQKIIDYYENFPEDEKLFIFNVTMQNHGGYDVNNGVIDTSITIDNFESSLGETYLSLMYESDRAFEYLLDYFSTVDEPTMIVMFGDHQPALPEDFYESLYAKDLKERSSWEKSLQYITPYIIWTNYESDFEQLSDISANYLGSYVLKCAGVNLPKYNSFLLKQRQETPVIGRYGIYNINGEFIDNENIPADLLNEYQILQYMRIKDRRSPFYNIFSVDLMVE